jgi:hypothetical protein
MSVRLLVALPPFPPGARVSFTESIESALVAAGLASANNDDPTHHSDSYENFATLAFYFIGGNGNGCRRG